MSEFKVKVIIIENMKKHPNADTLSIVQVGGFQSIVRTDDFKIDDKAVYIPIQAKLPDKPEYEFIKKGNKKMVVRTVKLRGEYSQGLIMPCPNPDWEVGQDVKEEMEITKWEPPIPVQFGGEFRKAPDGFRKYTEIENWQNYTTVFKDGEEVEITEKLHGTNCRIGVWEGENIVGSHNMVLVESDENTYWQVAKKFKVHDKIRKAFPDQNVIVFGEIIGQGIQKGYAYGHQKNVRELYVFDIFVNGKYLESGEVCKKTCEMELHIVPLFYKGPWKEELIKEYAYGNDSISNSIMREGVVIKTLPERFDEELKGRAILKFKSEDFLLRNKKGTDFR